MKNWIFLRGLMRSKTHWGPLPEVLKKAAPNHNFEFLDTPGNGHYVKQESPTSLLDYVHHLREQSQFIKKGERINLVGVSMGGMLATVWAQTFPTEIESLILVNISDNSQSYFWQRFQLRKLKDHFGVMNSFNTRTEQELAFLRITVNEMSEIERRRWAELFGREEKTSSKNLLRQMWAAYKFKIPPTPPVKNTKLFVGLKDHLVEPACTFNIAKVWGVPVVTHSTAGHDIGFEDPEWFSRQLLEDNS